MKIITKISILLLGLAVLALSGCVADGYNPNSCCNNGYSNGYVANGCCDNSYVLKARSYQETAYTFKYDPRPAYYLP